jgi:hypothetical protein
MNTPCTKKIRLSARLNAQDLLSTLLSYKKKQHGNSFLLYNQYIIHITNKIHW